MSRIAFDGSGDTQYAFIYNWESRLGQVSSAIVTPGQTYTANILVGSDGPAVNCRVCCFVAGTLRVPSLAREIAPFYQAGDGHEVSLLLCSSSATPSYK